MGLVVSEYQAMMRVTTTTCSLAASRHCIYEDISSESNHVFTFVRQCTYWDEAPTTACTVKFHTRFANMATSSYLRLRVHLDETPPENPWSIALQIPTANLPRFSRFPLKWVRYLGYAVLGTEGDLCHGPASSTSVDYNQPGEAITGRDYYYHAHSKHIHLH